MRVYGKMQYVIYKLTIDMDLEYVRLSKGLRESIDHQCFLTACVFGKYPSHHDLGKNDNLFSTNDNSWFTSHVGTSQLGGGH